jgi:hypothetical protein
MESKGPVVYYDDAGIAYAYGAIVVRILVEIHPGKWGELRYAVKKEMRMCND